MDTKQLVLFIDSGDTLVNEATEVRDDAGVVVHSELIPGAAEALRLIHEQGYTIALVADGLAKSFDNIYAEQGLRHCFDGWVVSETLGVEKPDQKMFQKAMDQLGLSDADKGRVVMVGNNLRRDIRGANLFGIRSVWLDWTTRYPRESRDADEVPDYTIHVPAELPSLLDRLEAALRQTKQSIVSALTANNAVNAELFRLDFEWTGPAPKLGQFFLIKPKRSGVFLARPISVFKWNDSDRRISFLIAKRGRGTEELLEMKIGETAELTGPLGNCWEDFLPSLHTSIETVKPLALVGGGIGVAPLEAIPAKFPQYNFDFYAGFRTGFKTPEERYGLLGPAGNNSQNLIIATEDDSEGKKGRITDFLDPAKYAAVYVCGPTAMLRAAAEKCKAAEVPCFISMEKHMACGVGACLGCTVKTKSGNKRCCADGPIFPAEEVIFE